MRGWTTWRRISETPIAVRFSRLHPASEMPDHVAAYLRDARFMDFSLSRPNPASEMPVHVGAYLRDARLRDFAFQPARTRPRRCRTTCYTPQQEGNRHVWPV